MRKTYSSLWHRMSQEPDGPGKFAVPVIEQNAAIAIAKALFRGANGIPV